MRAKLAARSPEERYAVWKNARGKGTPEVLELAAMCEELGIFAPGTGGLKMDDPLTLRMFDIINSLEGRAACIRANQAGWPAIAGVDPMLKAALPGQYTGESRATAAAGILVGELMRMLGYQHAASARCRTAPWRRPARSGHPISDGVRRA